MFHVEHLGFDLLERSRYFSLLTVSLCAAKVIVRAVVPALIVPFLVVVVVSDFLLINSFFYGFKIFVPTAFG